MGLGTSKLFSFKTSKIWKCIFVQQAKCLSRCGRDKPVVKNNSRAKELCSLPLDRGSCRLAWAWSQSATIKRSIRKVTQIIKTLTSFSIQRRLCPLGWKWRGWGLQSVLVGRMWGQPEQLSLTRRVSSSLSWLVWWYNHLHLVLVLKWNVFKTYYNKIAISTPFLGTPESRVRLTLKTQILGMKSSFMFISF